MLGSIPTRRCAALLGGRPKWNGFITQSAHGCELRTGVSLSQRLQTCELSNQPPKPAEGNRDSDSNDANQEAPIISKRGKFRRTGEARRLFLEQAAITKEYKKKLKEARMECISHAEEVREREYQAMKAKKVAYYRNMAKIAVEKRKTRIQKMTKQRERTDEDRRRIQFNEREAERVYRERESVQAQCHAMLVDELERESKVWLSSEEAINERINDDLWVLPGTSTGGTELEMPDDQYWRFSVDTGLRKPDGNLEDDDQSLSEGYIFMQMQRRMYEMKMTRDFVRDRRSAYANDTRGLLAEADRRLARKDQDAVPQGYERRRISQEGRYDPEAMELLTYDRENTS